jgi:hypothetical protein
MDYHYPRLVAKVVVGAPKRRTTDGAPHISYEVVAGLAMEGFQPEASPFMQCGVQTQRRYSEFVYLKNLVKHMRAKSGSSFAAKRQQGKGREPEAHSSGAAAAAAAAATTTEAAAAAAAAAAGAPAAAASASAAVVASSGGLKLDGRRLPKFPGKLLKNQGFGGKLLVRRYHDLSAYMDALTLARAFDSALFAVFFTAELSEVAALIATRLSTARQSIQSPDFVGEVERRLNVQHTMPAAAGAGGARGFPSFKEWLLEKTARRCVTGH